MVGVPLILTPTESKHCDWDWWMLLIHSSVRIKSERHAGHSFGRQLRPHTGNPECSNHQNRIQGETTAVDTGTAGSVISGIVYGTSRADTDGMWLPGSIHRDILGHYRPEVTTIPTPRCNHIWIVNQIQTLSTKHDKAQMRPALPVTAKELWQELADMTRDAQQSGEEVWVLRTWLANPLMFAARMAPAAPQDPEDSGQEFTDSLESSGSHWAPLRGWIA